MADVAILHRRERWRLLKDRAFGSVMAVGGIAVIVAILLIFFYLAYVVAPLFRSAALESRATFAATTPAAALSVDEYGELGFAIGPLGDFRFFGVADGKTVSAGGLAAAAGGKISTVATGDPAARNFVLGTANGRALLVHVDYTVSYPNDRREVVPKLEYPLGEKGIKISPTRDALRLITAQNSDDEATIAAVTADGHLLVVHLAKQTTLGGDLSLEETRTPIELNGNEVTHLAMDVDQRELFVVSSDGLLSAFDIRDKADIRIIDRTRAVEHGAHITAATILSGGISIVLGDDRGGLAQWFPVRDAANVSTLQRVRGFPRLPEAIRQIAPEYFRKGFAAVDDSGTVALYHSTSDQELARISGAVKSPSAMSLGPRNDVLLLGAGDGDLHTYAMRNPHPEISWRALWGEVWYESRDKPEYIWQSSSASADFEPKFSLMPLTFGTLKAAFYSMLFAMPLAVLGAIYTAYFMSAPMRAIVKPSIEVMAALPSVILGFLAGLWLAPLIERELLGVLLMGVLLPVVILTVAALWHGAPRTWRRFLPDGWEAAALVPIICLAVWAALALGRVLETLLFGDSFTHWLTVEHGLAYDQRNSLVVGIAIGFAVIPTIFTISEDAVFSVPRQLTMGSLALGATPWQTAIKVVLLTASPGIFSAVMIGMGRAVGETMVVLMATGNTPVMDLNIFQGFRALSANIAVELPESEVASTHYRILFLAALVLFLVTFVVNTLAEIVRQRLRRKYSSL